MAGTNSATAAGFLDVHRPSPVGHSARSFSLRACTSWSSLKVKGPTSPEVLLNLTWMLTLIAVPAGGSCYSFWALPALLGHYCHSAPGLARPAETETVRKPCCLSHAREGAWHACMGYTTGPISICLCLSLHCHGQQSQNAPLSFNTMVLALN